MSIDGRHKDLQLSLLMEGQGLTALSINGRIRSYSCVY